MPYGRTIITARVNLPEIKDFRINKSQFADSMVQGWYDAGPHGSRTDSMSFGRQHYTRIVVQLDDTRNIDIMRGPNDIIVTGFVKGPYAAIQDQGGVIPARIAIRGRLMRFTYWGKTVRASSVRESRIRPKQFIVRGLDRVRRNFGLIFETVWVRRTGGKNGL